MPDETEENIIKELEQAKIEPFKIIEEIPSELAIHQHDGSDGSPKINQINLRNREEGGKYGSMITKTTLFTTSSSTYVDVTDLSITLTEKETYKRRYLLLCSGNVRVDTAERNLKLTFSIDGTDQADLLDYYITELADVGSIIPFCIHYITNEITAASVNFKVRMRMTGAGAPNGYLDTTIIFSATRLLA